jgi:hypothetical protein
MKLATLVGASLILVPTLGSSDPTHSVLPAGKPAGIKQAEQVDNTTLYVVSGLAVLGIIIGVAASGDSSSASNTTPPVPTQH